LRGDSDRTGRSKKERLRTRLLRVKKLKGLLEGDEKVIL